MELESLGQWLSWLEQQHPKSIDLGLKRVAEVARSLNLTQSEACVVTVAGTNGKGSFVHTLGALLKHAGKRVGLYTSPHLLLFNERVVIDGEMVTDTALVDAFVRIKAACDELSISLSYFEFTTLAALWVFKQQSLDIIVLEVGLGGRLDAVNILDPDFAAITSIDIDHTEYLGDTREKIAFEKCGILREDTPFICLEPDAPDVLASACASHNAIVIDKDFTLMEGADQLLLTDNIDGVQYDLIQTGLAPASVVGALMLAKHMLKLSIDNPNDALNEIQLAGRFQRVTLDGVEVIADVAHNPQAAGLLHKRLASMPVKEGAKRIALFTMLEDKDLDGVVELLKDDFMAWFTAELDHPRARKAGDVANQIHEHGINMISVSKNLRQAFARARSLCQPDDQIVIFGSFFVVAELLPKLVASKNPSKNA